MTVTSEREPLPGNFLPDGISAHFVRNNNGLAVHFLAAGDLHADRPVLLLLHGFPELAYSWRKVMVPLAERGYRVIAPDQRGYGRTLGWTNAFGCDLREFALLNLVRDQLGVLAALGIDRVHAVIGHDFGSPVAAACALVRPDVFPRVAMMSAPYAGTPAFPRGESVETAAPPPIGPARAGLSDPDFNAALAELDPPRKHYQWYYSTPQANGDMLNAPQGLHAFLRAYYHHKSADWPDNRPEPLRAWEPDVLAVLPTYYVMRLAETMAETVAEHMPTAEEIAACAWLPDDELAVYASEYARTGFQGGLNWYRCVTGGLFADDLRTFAGRAIEVPATFISGKADWGTHQKPGDFEAMQTNACSNWRGTHLIDGAGHWVQQEQPVAVYEALADFIGT